MGGFSGVTKASVEPQAPSTSYMWTEITHDEYVLIIHLTSKLKPIMSSFIGKRFNKWNVSESI